MTNLDSFMRTVNLLMTDSIPMDEFYGVDLSTKKIKYENCISLYDLVVKFNKMYLSFKKDYEKIRKLNLGKYMSLTDYYEFDDFRQLYLYIVEPNCCEHKATNLIIQKQGDDVFSYITNGNNPFQKDYYKKDLDLDIEILNGYLNLFNKYKEFFCLYNYFKMSQIFSKGPVSLSLEINGELLDKLNSISLYLYEVYVNASSEAEITFELGDNLEGEYNKCKMEIDDENIDNEKINRVLKKVFINEKYLKDNK